MKHNIKLVKKKHYKRKTIPLVAGGLVALVSSAVVYRAVSKESVPETLQEQSFSEYELARYSHLLQEKWVQNSLKTNGIDDLFSDVILVTPENAHQHDSVYNRDKMVTEGRATLLTHMPDHDKGISKPILYIPTELFKYPDRNALAAISHEGHHASVYIYGLDFMPLEDFIKRDNPKFYSQKMFETVAELEALSKELDNGENFSQGYFVETKEEYLKFYIQLWWFQKEVRDDVAIKLQRRYFKKWMFQELSFLAFEEKPDSGEIRGEIKAGNRIPRLYLLETTDGITYIQFKFKPYRNDGTAEAVLIRRNLPSTLYQN